jgi:hypothetical protein
MKPIGIQMRLFKGNEFYFVESNGRMQKMSKDEYRKKTAKEQSSMRKMQSKK